MDGIKEYKRWIKNLEAREDIKDKAELLEKLREMDAEKINEAFYRDLEFGTGGLRGKLGPGTNRMNVLTVAKASQGLANYINKTVEKEALRSVVIGFDSRNKSELFSQVAAGVFAANDIKVFAWPKLLPVPTVSYAVRHELAAAGVMITASHNPKEYNGYKVYGADGCQITTEAAKAILEEIEGVDIFTGIKKMPWEVALINGIIIPIRDSVLDDFIKEVKNQSVLFGDEVNRDVAIVYSPLNGTGLEPVKRVLEKSGFTNISIVKEQRDPDGNFPTCPKPNPEEKAAMELGLRDCREKGADLLLATDPDCDRCGIAVKDRDDYRLLTGNEVGLLILDFICSQRQKHNKMPANPVFVKTIVTMDLAEKIAADYGVETINVLTGFKFIGEVIGKLEAEDRADDYICGFEESYGYLTGTYVRDKDAVNAAFMICEMFAFYKTRGISLLDKLNEICKRYGYCLNTLKSKEFQGASGMDDMRKVMDSFRTGVKTIGGYEVKKVLDYSKGIDGLPKSNVLKYFIDGGSVVIRPSGTEPKLKMYISVMAVNEEIAQKITDKIEADLKGRM